MDWSAIGDFALKNGLPLIGGLLGGPAGAAAGKLVATAIGVGEGDPQPGQVMEALRADPDKVLALRQFEIANRTELERLTIEAETTRLREVNETMRGEAVNADPFVRRARPALIWCVGLSILLEIVVGALIVALAPEQMGAYGSLILAMSTPQSVAAAMCGVYLKKRSDDKAIAAGIPPGPGLIQTLLNRT